MDNINKILPTEIISDILTRLPTQSVLNSKLVCKTWKNLILHPSFPQIHLTRLNNHNPDPSTGKLTYVFLSSDYYDYYVNNTHLYYFEYNHDEDWNLVKPICRKLMFETTYKSYTLIGSFNGLICIYGTQPDSHSLEADGPAIVCNPVTKEYIVLPHFESEMDRYEHLTCGFGYLSETNEYKVVRIYQFCFEVNFVEVEVYTVGSGKGWRYVGKFDIGFKFYTFKDTHGVFLNGCLHWGNNFQGAEVVFVFDLADEKFREHISYPPSLRLTDDDDFGAIQIGVSGGGILYYVCQPLEGDELGDAWLLMGENDKHVTIGQEEQQSSGWRKVSSLHQREPFAFMGGIIPLWYHEGRIKRFVSSTSTWENLVKFFDISNHVFQHQHTLVSLKALGEKDAKILADRASTGTWRFLERLLELG